MEIRAERDLIGAGTSSGDRPIVGSSCVGPTISVSRCRSISGRSATYHRVDLPMRTSSNCECSPGATTAQWFRRLSEPSTVLGSVSETLSDRPSLDRNRSKTSSTTTARIPTGPGRRPPVFPSAISSPRTSSCGTCGIESPRTVRCGTTFGRYICVRLHCSTPITTMPSVGFVQVRQRICWPPPIRPPSTFASKSSTFEARPWMRRSPRSSRCSTAVSSPIHSTWSARSIPTIFTPGSGRRSLAMPSHSESSLIDPFVSDRNFKRPSERPCRGSSGILPMAPTTPRVTLATVTPASPTIRPPISRRS